MRTETLLMVKRALRRVRAPLCLLLLLAGGCSAAATAPLAFDRPFDSSDWQSNVPITYFHGPHDPTTTTAQAEYHFERHPGAERQLVIVPEASHASLTLGLAGRGCAGQVWSALDAGDSAGLADVLDACGRPGETIELRVAKGNAPP